MTKLKKTLLSHLQENVLSCDVKYAKHILAGFCLHFLMRKSLFCEIAQPSLRLGSLP